MQATAPELLPDGRIRIPARAEGEDGEIGDGTRGPITQQLQSMYFEAVRGNRPQNAAWLTPVA